MHLGIIFLLGYLSYGATKINLRALTESMGQEVIEIGSKIKDLPPDLDEEPSADGDDDKMTSTTLETATQRQTRKDTTMDSRRKLKDVDKTDTVKEDDEARIDKELADMYKDTDYKSDNSETVEDKSTSTAVWTNDSSTDKPIARMRDNFRFQPDKNNPKDVERFRTSIDDINCPKNKLLTRPYNRGEGPLSTAACTMSDNTIQDLGFIINDTSAVASSAHFSTFSANIMGIFCFITLI